LINSFIKRGKEYQTILLIEYSHDISHYHYKPFMKFYYDRYRETSNEHSYKRWDSNKESSRHPTLSIKPPQFISPD